ncbi:hypothetical protein [Mesorhizobium sp. B2-3-4]|uniref:hypothetical protein n=1 Tax=Mesorhizobium sp. B2-3-4 TaxID=2589959 RepID=UPI00112E14FE|nr:hypothetical protein [Mesorhizobium sp. B2-3-4]TPM39570.1 hypothetical protein FJ967_08790 [Mesorhizobium sp. B2-3-4]
MDLKTGDTRLIIDTCKARGLLRNQCAYVLATTYHETAHTMKPITEIGSPKYLQSKPYWPFIGRGYVQITWEANYKKASDELGMPLLTSLPPKPYFVGHPNALLDPQYAAPVLVIGMQEGWFAGDKIGRHKLSRYMTLDKSDFKGARRVINGTDKAALIAGYAKEYDALLLDDGYGVSVPQPVPPAPVQPSPAPVAPAAPPASSPEPASAPPVITQQPSTPKAPEPKKPLDVITPAPGKKGLVTTIAAAIALGGMALSGWWHHITDLFWSIF